jgi:hypothetical protein
MINVGRGETVLVAEEGIFGSPKEGAGVQRTSLAILFLSLKFTPNVLRREEISLERKTENDSARCWLSMLCDVSSYMTTAKWRSCMAKK